MENIVELTESNFESEVLRGATPVLVDFYATWCSPCKALAPLLEQFAEEFQGRIKFAKLNVEDALGVAGQFQVTGVPTLMIFRDGKVVDSMVGLASPKVLKSWLERGASVKPSAAIAPKD